MTIKEITNQTEWTHFLNKCSSPTFLQSWEWGILQEKLKYGLIRLGLYRNEKLVGICQVIKIKAKRGNMLFVPHGPVLDTTILEMPQLENSLRMFLNFLKHIAKQERYDFIRIAPVLYDTPSHTELFRRLGMRTSPIYMHAERMWVLEISKNEDDLIHEMRKTTRYSIRKAAKDGATIEKRTDPQALDDFWGIYEQTAQREHFIPFSKSFIAHEFESFHKNGNALFLLGKIDGKYEAGALVLFTKSTAFYHQGASLHSKVPVAYLMQWEAIQEAKKRGCTEYNFWGILETGRTPKNWGGLSLFKQGFGGRQVDYVSTQDYIINPLKYSLSFLYEQYLKIKRGV